MSNSYKGYQSITSKAMKAEMLEQDVELELARNWHQKGCEKSLHRLVNAYMRLAVSMASKYVKYGVDTNETKLDEKFSTSFHYDEVFGTVINRFICQSVIGKDLTVYGNGSQTRGYLNIIDTINCVNIAVLNPPKKSEFRVFNQYTEVLSINDIAEKVISASNSVGIKSKKANIQNPRTEQEDHYYKPTNTSLIKLGLKPIKIEDTILSEMIKKVQKFKDRILADTVMPNIKWHK